MDSKKSFIVRLMEKLFLQKEMQSIFHDKKQLRKFLRKHNIKIVQSI
jgi:hypothetical protein